MIAYKSLDESGRSTYRKVQWPLPEGDQPGAWIEVTDEPVLCAKGLHAWLTRERAEREIVLGGFVYEAELEGLIVWGGDKAAAQRARLLRLVSTAGDTFKPYVVERGDRACEKCGEVHDCYIIDRRGMCSWADLDDGHAYHREPWEKHTARLHERIAELEAQVAA